VILATGAWTGALVNLQGRATATGQILAYFPITDDEQAHLRKMPVLLNMTTGLFIIPPANNVLKVARHGYGYLNPTNILDPDGSGEMITVSLPLTVWDNGGIEMSIPQEGHEALRLALREMAPSVAERPFTKERICWYTDTPNGDFLITKHPEFSGLVLATGGSGHGYKFLPVIGEKIVDCVEDKLAPELAKKWRWREEKLANVVTEDGSRGGKPGLILADEMMKSKSKL
jgi:sarcosine oxidase/L-pipecolate oxidase